MSAVAQVLDALAWREQCAQAVEATPRGSVHRPALAAQYEQADADYRRARLTLTVADEAALLALLCGTVAA